MRWIVTKPLSLHDCRDAFGLCSMVASKSAAGLSRDDREDLHAYLVVECWKLSTRFEPGRSTVSFTTHATTTLRLRAVDWRRQRFGRTKWKFAGHTVTRERPQLVPLDGGDDGDDRGRLGRLVDPGNGDPADSRSPDLAGLLGARDRSRARDLATLGL